MNGIYQHYIVDLSSNSNFVQVPTVQGDGNGIRGFEVELIQNGVPYVVDPNDAFIFIMGTKPDTKQIMNDCSLTEHGNILVDITSQMSAVKGRGDYQIVLMSKSKNSQLKSFPFYIITTPSAFDMDYIASSDEFQSLTRNITRTEEVIAGTSLAISDIRTFEASARKAEESRVSAESDRVNAETARTAAEAGRISGENTRIADENTRESNEATRQANESVRQTNESARQTNTAAAIMDAGNAADRANMAAEICEAFIDAGVVLQPEKGAAGGVATLDAAGKVPVAQIPGLDLPVSANVQAALDSYYQQSSGYTDQKIADLIGGAPSTLDTLGEIARAMEDNKNVVTALDEAVGKKAAAAEFDSHTKDSTAHVTAAERNNWNSKADGAHTHNYAAPGHTHDDRYYTEAEVDARLGGKADSGHTHNYAAAGHTHDDRYYTESEINAKLSGKADSSHTHDDRYYTEAEINTKLSAKADSSHSHDYVARAGSADSVAYSNVSGRPTFSLSGTTLTINF